MKDSKFYNIQSSEEKEGCATLSKLHTEEEIQMPDRLCNI